MRQICSAIGATTINPELLTAAERIQYEGYLRRRVETNAAILALLKDGMPIKQIVRQTGHSRKMVRQVIRGERNDVFRVRQQLIHVHLPWLDDQWAAGSRNGAELWRRLAARGFRGSLRVVSEWATRRRRAEKADAESIQRISASARTIARLMTTGRDTMSKAETVTIAAIEAGVPALFEARDIIAAFHAMIRRKAVSKLPPWIERARETLVASFASGVAKDEAAVRAGDRLAMVERPDRGPNHTAQTGKATNVRSRQNRPSSSQVNWRRMNVDDLLHQNCVRAPFGCRSGVPIQRRLTCHEPAASITPDRAPIVCSFEPWRTISPVARVPSRVRRSISTLVAAIDFARERGTQTAGC